MPDPNVRARRLLRAHLRGRQRWTLRYRGYIDEEVGGQKYRIMTNSTQGNVYRMRSFEKLRPDGLVVQPKGWDGYCIVIHYGLHYSIPDADHWLTQLLLLRADKKKFHKIALSTGYHRWGTLTQPWVSPYIY